MRYLMGSRSTKFASPLLEKRAPLLIYLRTAIDLAVRFHPMYVGFWFGWCANALLSIGVTVFLTYRGSHGIDGVKQLFRIFG